MATDSLPGGNNFPNYYQMLSEDDINNIHSSTLEILETTGVVVTHRGVIDLLVDAGCVVNLNTRNVNIPEKLVEQCLKTTPSAFIMAGRNQKDDLQIGAPGKIYNRNGGGPGHVQDLDTGLVRDASLSDVRDYAKLVDAVENLDIAAPIYGQDIDPNVRDLTVLATMFASTFKHINMRLLQLSSLPYVLKMAEIVAGSRENLRSRPVITLLESPVAPLQLPDVLVETLLACGAYGIPVELCSMPIAGATGPLTLAGSLLMSNVEMIASIVVSQLANPGAPLVFTPRIMIMDMRSGHAMTGSIENALLASAGVQLAKNKYNIPVNVHGPYTDSITSDTQAGIENTYFTLLPALSGANILTGAGHLEGGLFVSFPQLIIDSEINGITQRLLEGFEVNANTLAVEAIQRSIRKNNVLADPHTRSNLRKVNRYQPILLNRIPRQTWVDQGSPTMQDRAHAKVRELLASHEPDPLDPAIEKELQNLLQHAKKELTS
jgi:trimethylamine--corrinoid protein Co-methyltransferase